MRENLVKASQTSNLLVSDLRQCCSQATATEEIVVRGILRQATEVERMITELVGAVNPGNQGAIKP